VTREERKQYVSDNFTFLAISDAFSLIDQVYNDIEQRNAELEQRVKELEAKDKLKNCEECYDKVSLVFKMRGIE